MTLPTATKDLRQELERIERVSNMLCTMHFFLKDLYARRALCLDLFILLVAVLLLTVIFPDPEILAKIPFIGPNAKIWIGVLAIVNFFLSIAQLKLNWKGLSDAHDKAGNQYFSIKLDSKTTLAQDPISPEAFKRILDLYENCSTTCEKIPEGQFLKLKKAHKLKVAMSRYLDKRPGASIWLLKLRLWFSDNKGVFVKDPIEEVKYKDAHD